MSSLLCVAYLFEFPAWSCVKILNYFCKDPPPSFLSQGLMYPTHQGVNNDLELLLLLLSPECWGYRLTHLILGIRCWASFIQGQILPAQVFSSTPAHQRPFRRFPHKDVNPCCGVGDEFLMSLFSQVHRWLLLHPILCRRPARRGPLLSQLQSAPGHLQALVGLGQPAIGEMVDPCYRKSPDPCPAHPEEAPSLISSLHGLHLRVFWGMEKVKKVTSLQTPETAAWSCALQRHGP